ncbi:uncharacterized protein METZ01_LOCUS154121 [marine metagenome]|uniref:Uncharacterized protein n=1 Tax=marine metagenome TaxID=408172 RepID=A0A382AJU3_9ZZZZ
MKYPEGQQKDESREVYIRRISKFPTLSPNTILRVVFRKANQDNLQRIKDWARPVFPKAFPPEGSNGIPYLNPENISTKAFANWVVEENIFEAWVSLGQKVSPFAELFIELVNGKAIDSKQVSKKAKRKKPHSSTDRGRLDVFKNEKFIPLVEQVLEKNSDWQNRQILAHKKVENALDKCGFPEGKPSESTIKKWICIARKNIGARAKTGRPTK